MIVPQKIAGFRGSAAGSDRLRDRIGCIKKALAPIDARARFKVLSDRLSCDGLSCRDTCPLISFKVDNFCTQALPVFDVVWLGTVLGVRYCRR